MTGQSNRARHSSTRLLRAYLVRGRTMVLPLTMLSDRECGKAFEC